MQPTATTPKILIIVTSFQTISPTQQTGIWLEEFAVPYFLFEQENYQITVASIQGGQAPIDPNSHPDQEQETLWQSAIDALQDTQTLSTINPDEFDAVFMPGGHGTMYDFPQSETLTKVLTHFVHHNKLLAAVCHGPACLVNLTLADGAPFVSGKTLTSFTNEEETAAVMTNSMPFLLESRLRDLQANFIAKPNWDNHIEIDGQLMTGQNPQSTEKLARAMIENLSLQTSKEASK